MWRLGSRWLGVCRWFVATNRESVVRVVSKHVSRNVVSYRGHWSQVTMVLVGRIQEVPECANVFVLGCGEKMVPITLKHPTCCREVCDAVVELDSSMNIAEDVHRLGAWLAHGRP